MPEDDEQVIGGRLFIWGKCSRNSKDQIFTKPQCPTSYFFDEQVIQVVCGNGFTAVLTKDQEVFSIGSRSWFTNESNDSQDFYHTITHWEDLSGRGITKIACGKDFMAAMTGVGLLYTWGTGKHGQLGLNKEQLSTAENFKIAKPTLVESLFDVTDISCGEESIAAITSEGKLYTWGKGNSGILGHENEETQFEPKQIFCLDEETVTLVRLGTSHMACLSDNRELWTCGNNFLGQLGRILPKSKEADFCPKVVELIQTGAQITEENLKGSDEVEFTDLCCLKFNTLVLTSEGQLYSCGKGGSDGGGHGDNPHTLLCVVESVKDLCFSRLSSGYSHHIAAISENGSTYIWGNGEYGKLGLNDGGESHSFPQILFPKSGSPGHRTVIDIACGETHSAAILIPIDSDERPDIISTEASVSDSSEVSAYETQASESVNTSNLANNTATTTTSENSLEQEDKKKRPVLKSDDQLDEQALIESIKFDDDETSVTRKKGATLRVSTIDGDAERHSRSYSTNTTELKNGAVNSSSSNDENYMSGYLNKKGEKGIVKLWRKRWFQMTKDSIEYLEKEKGALKGEIKLANIMDILPGSSPFSFNIISKTGRIYELQASKREEMEKWSKAIKTARNNIK